MPAYGVHDGAKVVLCSDELAEMFGIASGADVVGRDILTFIAPDARDQAIATVLMGGPGSNELVGIRADGGLFPIGVQSCEIRLRGYGEGRIVLIRDLSPIALVVDDEPQVTRMTAFLMRHIGYQVIAYTSSRQALADYQPGVPSVIVSDILMPDLDGVVMTQRMRKVDPTVPVIFVSGFSTETVPQGDGSIFVKKPFVITDLQNALKELPERARARLQCAPPRG